MRRRSLNLDRMLLRRSMGAVGVATRSRSTGEVCDNISYGGVSRQVTTSMARILRFKVGQQGALADVRAALKSFKCV